MGNFGAICYGLLNLFKVHELTAEFVKSTMIVFKAIKKSAGCLQKSGNFLKSGTDPVRLKGIKKSTGVAGTFDKVQS